MAEAMALSGLLKFFIFLDIQKVAFYGDSKLWVDSVNQKNFIQAHHLSGWRDRIQFYWNCLENCSIQHINREKNSTADGLSKKGLFSTSEYWHLEIVSDDSHYQISDFALPDL